MMPKTQPILPAGKADKNTITIKIERAKEVREASAKIREGKPLAFPTHRTRA